MTTTESTTETTPSDIVLRVPPLAGTMQHAECEHAAALLIRALQLGGNTWRPVGPAEIGTVLRDDTDPELSRLWRNPFLRPDFHKLVANGFARWVVSDAKPDLVELTDAGRAALARWTRTATPTARG